MEYRALIQRFAERLGLKDDIIDPDGFARVTAGELTLAMAEVEGARQLVLFIDLGPAKREVYESLLEKMFMGCGTKGSVYSINEGRLYLHRFERLDELDAEKLIDVANALLDLSTERFARGSRGSDPNGWA